MTAFSRWPRLLVGAPPLWVAAFGGQISAAWLVIRGDAERGEYDVPAFVAFSTQLALSLAWLLLFFRLQRPAVALADVCALWLAVAVTIREYARRHRVAAALLLPYLAWVSLAGAVNLRACWRRGG
ncbi:MAG TPA: TspO/MBR family protein [Mycobacteriales bacterium]|nr:TspO/MBR family protein [Mycobacteriales bacterium]